MWRKFTNTGDSGNRRASRTMTIAGNVANKKTPRQPMSGRNAAVRAAPSIAPTGQPLWTKLYMKPRLPLRP